MAEPNNDGLLRDAVTTRRRPLGCFPTPLYQDEQLGSLLGIEELWIKRDDLTGFGWGGNKVRTVEFLLGDALAQGATTVVMAAGPSSNFAATMASAAIGAGLAVEQICYGTAPERPPAALGANLQSGVEVLFTGSDDRGSMERLAAERVTAINGVGGVAYAVPRGGATTVGSLGFVNAAVELADQLTTLAFEPAHIVMAVGSGGSIAGLLAGQAALGVGWPTIGVSVSRPIDDISTTVTVHAKACRSLLGLDDSVSTSTASTSTVSTSAASTSTASTSSAQNASAQNGVVMVDGRGDGFGAIRDDETELAIRVENHCGLLLDPVYTAKAIRWLADAKPSGPVLFWHTGGALGVADRLSHRWLSQKPAR